MLVRRTTTRKLHRFFRASGPAQRAFRPALTEIKQRKRKIRKITRGRPLAPRARLESSIVWKLG